MFMLKSVNECEKQHYSNRSKLEKKPKYPVTSRWLNQLDTAKVEYHSSIKEHECVFVQQHWMDLKKMMLSEISHLKSLQTI